jgi:glucosamine kinase
LSRLLIGVDGGGTRTRVLVEDESGATLGAYEAEGSAIRPNDIARSARIISTSVRSALSGASDQGHRSRVLCVGVAGAGRQMERESLALLLTQENIADEVFVESDAMVAMEDAFGEGPGVLLIAGTGSVAFGRGPTGSLERCGGWGPTLGDEGSSYWLGRRALSAITAATDGREPDTALTGGVLTALQLNDTDELIRWAASAEVPEIAGLARTVMQAAANDDLRADSLVSLAAEELALHIRTLARKLFVDERAAFDVALAGGLMEHGSLLRKRLAQRIRTAVPGAELRTEEVSASRGALKMAKRLLAVGAS